MGGLELWRKEFPILDRTTYLNSCSLGAMPRGVPESAARFHQLWQEKGTPAWHDWFDAVTDLRRSFAGLVGAKLEEVAVTYCVSAGMTSIASALSFKGKRNKVVFADQEFPSSAHVWQRYTDYGAKIDIVRSKDGITVPLDAWQEKIDKRTLIIPTSHVFFRSGAMQDAKALTEIAHDKGAYMFLDNYQSLGNIPHNLHDLGVDMAIGGLLKWCCGGPGIVLLYVREGLLDELRPRALGWLATKDPFAFLLEDWEHAPDATRFTYGTPPVTSVYTSRPGLEIVKEVGVEAIRKESMGLANYVVQRAQEKNWPIRSPLDGTKRSGIVTVGVPNAEAVCPKLVEQGIIVDYRPGAGIRVAPHFYNTRAEIDTFFDAAETASAERPARSGGPRRF